MTEKNKDTETTEENKNTGPAPKGDEGKPEGDEGKETKENPESKKDTNKVTMDRAEAEMSNQILKDIYTDELKNAPERIQKKFQEKKNSLPRRLQELRDAKQEWKEIQMDIQKELTKKAKKKYGEGFEIEEFSFDSTEIAPPPADNPSPENTDKPQPKPSRRVRYDQFPELNPGNIREVMSKNRLGILEYGKKVKLDK